MHLEPRSCWSDPAEYIFNPVKLNYDTAARFCDGVLKTLPTSAVYRDDESKGVYPIEYYYQEVKGRRPDVEINRIFGLIMNKNEAEQHARRMLSQLREGRPVYLAGIVRPEREILNRLYTLPDPDLSLNAVRSMGSLYRGERTSAVTCAASLRDQIALPGYWLPLTGLFPAPSPRFPQPGVFTGESFQ